MPHDLSCEDWEELRRVATAAVLGAMNLELARSSQTATLSGDLQAMWAHGWFDPADGLVSRAFLERYATALSSEGCGGIARAGAPLLQESTVLEPVAALLRSRLRPRPNGSGR